MTFDKKSIALLGLALPVLASGNTSQAQWQQYADALKTEPGLIRFYSFKTEGQVQTNMAAAAADITFKGPHEASPKMGPGRIEGLQAPAIDAESFRASAISESNNAFSVSIWVKPEGAGVKQSGGRVNGMIASSGSGYYDGWRLAVYDISKLTPSFEIGRGQSSVNVVSKDSLSRGLWNHIAATWDGAVMKIYVNGILSGSRDFTGPCQPAKDGLSIGYSGYGVGSLKMEVDEIAVFNRSLAAARVAALSLTTVDLPGEVAAALNRASALQLTGRSGEAGSELKKLLSGQPLPPALACWIRVAALQLAVQEQSPDVWINQCIALYEDQATPPHLKGKLLSQILDCCSNVSLSLPSRVLEMLPSARELSDEDKFTCAVALARSYAAEQKPDKAHQVFEHLIAVSAEDSGKESDLRFKFAQSLRTMGKNSAAVEQYEALAQNPKQPENPWGQT